MKKLMVWTLTATLALGLVGCGTADPKESFVTAHKALETADTYHFDANVKMDVKSSQTTDEAKMAMEMLGKMKMNLSGDVDNKAQKSQYLVDASIPMGGMGFNINMPILADTKNGKVYVEGDKIPMLGATPELKGKLIESDVNADSKNSTVNADLYNKLDSKSFVSEDVSKDEKAKGAKQKVTVELDPATAQTLFDEYMSKSGGGAGLTGGMQDAKLKGGHFVGLIGAKDQPISDDIELVVTAQGDELTMNVHIDYSKFGEKVSFTIDPSKAEIIKSDELQGLGAGAGGLGGSL